jgi:two-component system, chemotaxis family, sensor kinase CheA
MSDTRTELVEQFVIETQQHIDEIEPILLAAEWEVPDKPAIAALFRCFHSIKGLSRMLGVRGLETVAHHAESLLGEVRSDRLKFTRDIQDLLLQAFDAIRLLRDGTIDNGQDSAAPADLIAALQAAATTEATTTETPPDGPEPAVLHEDADTLAYFAEMLRESLPNLAVFAGIPGDRAQAAEDIESLILAAERLDLKGLQNHLERLGATSSIDCLADLISDATRFAKLTAQDAGADALALALSVPLQTARAAEARNLLRAIGKNAITSAQRLLRLSPADDLPAVLLQAFLTNDPTTVDAARTVVELLADDLERGTTVRSDVLVLATDNLNAVLAARRAVPAPLSKLLADRGVDTLRIGPIGPAAQARLASILEGGDCHLLAVTTTLPRAGTREEFLAWLEQRLDPIVAEISEHGGVAMLVATKATAESVNTGLQVAYPSVGAAEIHRLDGHFLDHPWAPANASRIGSARGADDNQVRVPVEILDRLFGRIGEFFNISSALNVLMVDSQVPGVLQRLNDHIVMTAPALLPAMDILQRQQADLAQIEAEVHRLVSLIHEATLGLRVIPLDTMFNRYPRMIRELAKEQNKQIRFETQSNGIKVDKGMTELLGDPLMHILRNSVDHGVESAEQRQALGKPPVARITLTAVQNGNRIAVEIADDGRGIDAERVRRQAVAQSLVTESDSLKLSRDQIHRFVFAPGFSTAEKLTETSGRGVGMDVALVNISRLGGRIDIQTVPGQGTTFRLDMPLSAAMQTVLLAETAVQTVAFPERMVVEAVTVAEDSVQYVNGQRALLLHDRFLPLFRLTDLLRLPEAPTQAPSGDITLVVVAANHTRYGVEVNRVLRRHEMLIRETHPRIAQLPGIGGVSTLGSDRIVLVIDPDGLTDLARSAVMPGLRAAARAAA